MPVFQVSSKSVQLTAPPKKRARRFPSQWYVVARFFIGGCTGGLIFGFLVTRFTMQSHDAVFVLLPVLLSLATAQFRGYNFRALFNGTLVYLLLSANILPGMFVTCFFALLDPESGRLCYANAGHDLPYRQQKGSVSSLWATGMPLGMMPGSNYEEYEVTIAPGENLLFYSDGLVEAHNPRREMFDTPRLKAVLAEYAGGGSLIDTLLSELRCFTGEGWEQEDDVTLVTLQRGL